ncbi:MAG: lipoprotein intramolecular transacylase Lit [Alphaproteobacteria bacterium]
MKYSAPARAAGVVGAMVALLVAAGAGAGVVLFTYPVFEFLGFHPIALDYFGGRIAPAQMAQKFLLGARFAPAEIAHLDDVAVMLTRIRQVAMVASTMVIALTASAPVVMGRAAVAALALFASLAGLVGAAYAIFGFERVGAVFHTLFFPSGNWRFGWDALIIRLYGANEMVSGAGFVIGATLAIVVAVLIVSRWLGARRAARL